MSLGTFLGFWKLSPGSGAGTRPSLGAQGGPRSPGAWGLQDRAPRPHNLTPGATYGGTGEDWAFCGFHHHSVGRTPGSLLGLVLLQLLAEARHRGLRAVLGVGGVRPIARVAGGYRKPDNTRGWLGGRGGQPVQAVGRRHLFTGIPHRTCDCPVSEFKASCRCLCPLPRDPPPLCHLEGTQVPQLRRGNNSPLVCLHG